MKPLLPVSFSEVLDAGLMMRQMYNCPAVFLFGLMFLFLSNKQVLMNEVPCLMNETICC